MSYIVQNGQFVWAGPGPEPMTGETMPQYAARLAALPAPGNGSVAVSTGLLDGVVAPQAGQLVPSEVQPGQVVGEQTSLLSTILGLALTGTIGALVADENGGVPQVGAHGQTNGHADWFGTGKAGRGGSIAANKTTKGTGIIAESTVRGYDPLQGLFYQQEGNNPYSDISFSPGKIAPTGQQIVKAWVTNAVRKDNSLATTQFARLADGRMMSMSEEGIIKSWRPVKNIVMARGKTTLSQAVKAQRYLDRMWRKVAKRTKQLKLA